MESPQKKKPPLPLRIATWNIHYGIGNDGKFDLDRICSTIKKLDADIIGLQEVGWHRDSHNQGDHFSIIQDQTGYDVIKGLVRDPLRSHFGNAILTRLKIKSKNWIDLKIPCHAPRAAVVAKMQYNGDTIRAMVTHLGLLPWERHIQAKRLTAEYQNEKIPTILMGDFNIWQKQTLTSQSLANHFPKQIYGATYPAQKPIAPLDRIYLSPEIHLLDDHVHKDNLARQSSDHLPLVAQVKINPDDI